MESDEAQGHSEEDWEQEPTEPHPDDEPSQSKGPPSRWWSVFRWVLIVGFFFLGCGIGAVAYLVHVNSQDLPSVEQLKAGYNPPQITRVLARDSTLLKAVFTERRTVIPFEQIPNSAKLAFLAAEDAHFYEHEGLNYWGMLRALLRNVRAGHAVQGGSTITQQVVKNVLLDSSRTLRRKIRELILSRRLEQSLTKDEIFWLYLNHIYLGHGRYGIEEAARFYFGKKASELRVEEAATLAGLVAAPERFSPRRDAKRALERRRYVLDQMLEKGFMTPDLYAQVKDAPLRLSPLGEGESEVCPEIVPFAEDALRAAVGERARTGGFVVNTTIDPTLQAQARAALREGLDNYAKRHSLEPPLVDQKRSAWGDPFVGDPRVNGIYVGVVKAVDDANNTIDVAVGSSVGTVQLAHEQRYNPHHLPPSQFTRIGAVLRVGVLDDSAADGKMALRLELGPQAALIALDVRTREVLALVGGYDGVAGGLDRATQTKRQPGSTFKPITYSYALHSHLITPATVLHVRHEHDKEGPIGVRVRQALAESNNRAAEFVFKQSGAKEVVDWAHQLGVESKLGADKSLALGSYEVSVLELANAYATFASGGDEMSPVMIRSVQGVEGALPLPPAAARRQVMTADEAYMITSLLRSVVQEGTGMGAQRVGRPVAGKTGTTNRVKDAWFIGYSTEIVAAVWVGYDDALPLGRGEQGSATALPMWVNFMKQAHEHRPATEFPRPAGIIEVSIDPKTGLLPYPGEQGLIQEEFLDGTVPMQAAVPDAGVEKVRQDPPDGGAPVRGGIDPHP